ncbi:MAG: hypothetical protein HS122_12670 [Opitutaceae bacterium]|nr:hypothetical protein [Opitutaceae bacterium]
MIFAEKLDLSVTRRKRVLAAILCTSVSVVMAGTIRNEAFELTLKATDNNLECRIHHRQTKIELAAGNYAFPFPLAAAPKITSAENGVTVTGEMRGGLGFVQKLTLPAGKPWLEEEITLTNRNSFAVALPNGRAGFVLPVPMQGSHAEGGLATYRFAAIPFVREPTGGNRQRADYSLTQVLTQLRTSTLRSREGYRTLPRKSSTDGIPPSPKVVTTYAYAQGIPKINFPQYASEGWCIYDGNHGFVISKYSQKGMEWSVLDQVPLEKNRLGLRWGGFAIYRGDPEHGAWLQPGQSYTYGVTRLTAFEGGLNEGFYTYRSEMESRGMGCPKGFNAPVHWNELYDNSLYWMGLAQQDLPENRAKYYTLADMKAEAAKARAIGCEALYLDPGWDTNFASKIWDEARLGPIAEFSAMLKREYGLSLSLHTPLSGWCNPFSYPLEAMRLNHEGKRLDGSLCAASRLYRDETVRRLLELADGGARYFMFDGSMYHGECRDPAHGHPIPARRQEHVAALNEITRRVHAKYPDLQIEMHDQMLGGTRLRYVPTYFGYGEGGYDTVWAYELMWEPMRDLVGGHSIALYYYNLAYSIPLYLHIDLRKDTREGLMFWWNASTVRHLGIGGTHHDPAIAKMHHEAMSTYMRLKSFFAAGTFYGIDERTHVHRHPDRSAAVLNCFNLTDRPETRRITFDPARFGLDPNRSYQVAGATVIKADRQLELDIPIHAYGHTLVEIR